MHIPIIKIPLFASMAPATLCANAQAAGETEIYEASFYTYKKTGFTTGIEKIHKLARKDFKKTARKIFT